MMDSISFEYGRGLQEGGKSFDLTRPPHPIYVATDPYLLTHQKNSPKKGKRERERRGKIRVGILSGRGDEGNFSSHPKLPKKGILG